MYELIYTSLPQGLLAGRSGFSTAAVTDGFPGNLISPIENLSTYKNLFPPGDPDENHNPVNYSCQHYQFGGTLYIVLSRISFAGLSYTGRSNILAHHLLFTPEELARIPGGPAAVLRAEENFPPWSGPPRVLPPKGSKSVKYKELPTAAPMWKKFTGDERWAEYVADTFRFSSDDKVVLSFDPVKISGEDILELLGEISAKLTPEELLKLTFNTYSYSSGIANPVFLRAYPENSALLGSVKRLNPMSIIELGKERNVPEEWSAEKNALPEKAAYEIEYANKEEEQIEHLSAGTENHSQYAPEKQYNGKNTGTNGRKLVSINSFAPENIPFPGEDKKKCSKSASGAIAENFENAPVSRKHIYIRVAAFVFLVLLLGGLVWSLIWRSAGMPENTSENINGEILSEYDKKINQKEGLRERLHKDRKVKNLPGKKEKANEAQKSGKSVTAFASEPAETVSAASVFPRKKEEKKEIKSTVENLHENETESETPDRKKGRFDLLAQKDLYDLYIAYWKTPFPGSIPLPGNLKRAKTMTIELALREKKYIGEWKKFVSGNDKAKIDIYAVQLKTVGLLQEYVPRQESSLAMRLSLKEERLFIYLPPEGKNQWKRIHIQSLTFFDEKKSSFVFYPCIMPKKFHQVLEKKFGRIRTKVNGYEIVYHLHVSDLLWDFRHFYDVKVDKNANSGKRINSRVIEIKRFDFSKIIDEIKKRNEVIEKWRNAEKASNSFKKRNQKNLSVPELKELQLEKTPAKKKVQKPQAETSTEQLEKLINPPESGKDGKKALSVEKTAENKDLAEIEKEDSEELLKLEVQRQKNLREYEKQMKIHKETKKKLMALEMVCRRYRQRMTKCEVRLESMLKKNSVHLYRKYKPNFEKSRMIDPEEFFTGIKKNMNRELTVKIVRRTVNESY